MHARLRLPLQFVPLVLALALPAACCDCGADECGGPVDVAPDVTAGTAVPAPDVPPPVDVAAPPALGALPDLAASPDLADPLDAVDPPDSADSPDVVDRPDSADSPDVVNRPDSADSPDLGFTEPRFTVQWDADSVELAIRNGDQTAHYWFGMAETAGCDPEFCWTGEDCVHGYVANDGTLFGPYCHYANASGVRLTYGGDPTHLVGDSTVFSDPSFADSVTYLVELDGSSTCWVWGNSPSYYDGEGCTTLRR